MILPKKEEIILLGREKNVEPLPLDDFLRAYDKEIAERLPKVHTPGEQVLPVNSTGSSAVSRLGNFSTVEDIKLLRFVLAQDLRSRCGKIIYHEFHSFNKHRSAQSWRNRYVRHLKQHIETFVQSADHGSIPSHILNFLNSGGKVSNEEEVSATRPRRPRQTHQSTVSSTRRTARPGNVGSVRQQSRSSQSLQSRQSQQSTTLSTHHSAQPVNDDAGMNSDEEMFQDDRPPDLEAEKDRLLDLDAEEVIIISDIESEGNDAEFYIPDSEMESELDIFASPTPYAEVPESKNSNTSTPIVENRDEASSVSSFREQAGLESQEEKYLFVGHEDLDDYSQDYVDAKTGDTFDPFDLGNDIDSERSQSLGDPDFFTED